MAAKSLGEHDVTVAKYLRVRERQTRQTAAVFWQEKEWPWEEAMRKAWESDLAILWTVTSQNNAFGLQVAIPGITDAGTASTSDHPPPPPARAEHKGTKRSCESEDRRSSNMKWLVSVPNHALEAWMCCSDWNDRRGCPAKQAWCPHERLHRCNAIRADGRICGSQTHCALDHRAKEHERQRPADKGKGKGKTTGKGKDSRKR